MSDGQKQALAAFVVIALLGGAYVVLTGRSDEGVSCYATSAGVGVVAEGLRKNQSAGAIVAAAGAGFLASKCEDWVETLVEDPEKQTELEVEASGQAPAETTVTGNELAEPPPSNPSPAAPADASFQRTIDCFRWRAELLTQWCWDGRIEPPPATYAPEQGL